MGALEEELAQQRLWKKRPGFENFRAFDTLLENEFLSPAEHSARAAAGARGIVRYAAQNVPYYAKLFARLGLQPQDIDGIDELAKLPPLSKHDVLEQHDELRARSLPPGEAVWGRTQSSGTTGRRVAVVHSNRSNAMFHLLRHRNCRWHRLHPMRSRVDVRPGSDVFPARQAGQPEPRYLQMPAWRYLGRFFETGPEFAFPLSRPMEQQVELLAELRPDYAMSMPGAFEEWLFANNGRNPADSLKCLIGVGSQLTPSLRARLEQGYGIPVHMSYGLNEIGMVGVRCREGRYHVHSEHCLVEIADNDGHPCPPGQTGHVLVTGLSNLAMPLIRYDTGDLAEVAEGPCPCGRTLPSFGKLGGRYRRYAGLPDGTRERIRAIRVAIESSSHNELAFLRRYQVYQDRQNNFTLRLRTAGPIPDAFRAALQKAWEPVLGNPPSPLTIVELDQIATSSAGKILDFVSDFHTDSAAAPSPEATTQPLADT